MVVLGLLVLQAVDTFTGARLARLGSRLPRAIDLPIWLPIALLLLLVVMVRDGWRRWGPRSRPSWPS